MSPPPPLPVESYRRLSFADPGEAERWAQGLQYRLGTAAGAAYRSYEPGRPRVVVWVPDAPARRARGGALFVSAGAIVAAMQLGLRVEGGAEEVPLAELPDGLTLLLGHEVDAAAYVDRHDRPRPRVTTPADGGALVTAGASSGGGGGAPAPPVVLLVEDDDAVRTVVARILERGGGYRVVQAPDAEQAMALAAQLDGPIELLVTDFKLPGASGAELADWLTAERPRLPVLLMSGWAPEEVRETLAVAGRSEVLWKPFESEALLRAARAVRMTDAGIGPPRGHSPGHGALVIRAASYGASDASDASRGRRQRRRLEAVDFTHAGREYRCRVDDGGRWEYEVEQLISDSDPAEGGAGGGGWYRWRERWPDDSPEEVAAGVVHDDRLRRDLVARTDVLAVGHQVGRSRMYVDTHGTGWHVYEWEAGDEAPPERRGRRCLVFEAAHVTSRLWDYPEDWRELPPDRLQALGGNAAGRDDEGVSP